MSTQGNNNVGLATDDEMQVLSFPQLTIGNRYQLLWSNLEASYCEKAFIEALLHANTNDFADYAEDIVDTLYKLVEQHYHALYKDDFDDLLFDKELNEAYVQVQDNHPTMTENEMLYRTYLKLLDIQDDYRLYHFDQSQLIRHEFSDRLIREKFPVSCITREDVLVVISDETPTSFLEILDGNRHHQAF